MRRPWTRLILLALVLAASGCGGDDDSGEKSGPGTGTTTDELREGGKPNPKEVAGARQEAADEKRNEREEKELKEDEKFDRSFEDTPFDRLVDKLPIRKPPLYIEQYISGDGHKLYVAVRRKRFCGLSAARRKSAVTSYFRRADANFRGGKVDDLELVVTPVSETLEKLPALATASGKTVTLTRLGRDC